MTQNIFGQIGPYAILRPIGQGGMAHVFLARDTRTDAHVALKVVHLGTDEEAREILQSEQRGAELQQRFSSVSDYVPKVYETNLTPDYFYIAMEYIDGEDLSQAIHRGPMPWQRAVGITSQLCEFLEEAYRFEADAGSRRVLLHNDLKPRNVRLMAPSGERDAEADRIKVLDFGAAKALSLSRKVTRNDFGSTAYLSPECLESGDRDLHSDAWALGVLLYEMVRGRQPFRAEDTRRLEQRIRSRTPPESIHGTCPPAVEAVIAKLLAPYPEDRYDTPAEIRADLSRALAGVDTVALAEGWPDKASPDRDEPVTRRTAAPDVPTRRTSTGSDDEPVTRATPRLKSETPEPPATPPPVAPPVSVPKPRSRVPRLIRNAAIVVFLALAANEGCVASQANDLAGTVPVQTLEGLAAIWPKYESLAGHSMLGGWGVKHLESTLTSQAQMLAERVMTNYRTTQPTVREGDWKDASEALRHALAIAPSDRKLRASLSYCEGQLHRINGEAAKSRNEQKKAREEITAALVSFREAIDLRPNWADPYLGLARTFIYGEEDVDRGADALNSAAKYGHTPSERETTQLADGFRARGEALLRTAVTLKGMPQERDYLTRASQAFHTALDRYATIAGFGNAALNLKETQKRIDRIDERLAEIEREGGGWPWD